MITNVDNSLYRIDLYINRGGQGWKKTNGRLNPKDTSDRVEISLFIYLFIYLFQSLFIVGINDSQR